jgi:F-type H+-transporting ATPase subunit delta
MKVSKDARNLSRRLLRLSFTNERLDESKVRSLVQSVLTEKPRHYLGALEAYQHLLRLEQAKRRATIESATELDTATQSSILSSLRHKYGADIDADFRVNRDLIGGLRIQLGSDVWDGSVQNRLDRLSANL